jgi:hypothetical protein
MDKTYRPSLHNRWYIAIVPFGIIVLFLTVSMFVDGFKPLLLLIILPMVFFFAIYYAWMNQKLQFTETEIVFSSLDTTKHIPYADIQRLEYRSPLANNLQGFALVIYYKTAEAERECVVNVRIFGYIRVHKIAENITALNPTLKSTLEGFSFL